MCTKNPIRTVTSDCVLAREEREYRTHVYSYGIMSPESRHGLGMQLKWYFDGENDQKPRLLSGDIFTIGCSLSSLGVSHQSFLHLPFDVIIVRHYNTMTKIEEVIATPLYGEPP